MSDGIGGLLEQRAIRRPDEQVADRLEAIAAGDSLRRDRRGRRLVHRGDAQAGNDVSTYIGEGVAIPHSTNASKQAVLRDALVVQRFAEPVGWDGFSVTVCVTIAACSEDHIGARRGGGPRLVVAAHPHRM